MHYRRYSNYGQSHICWRLKAADSFHQILHLRFSTELWVRLYRILYSVRILENAVQKLRCILECFTQRLLYKHVDQYSNNIETNHLICRSYHSADFYVRRTLVGNRLRWWLNIYKQTKFSTNHAYVLLQYSSSHPLAKYLLLPRNRLYWWIVKISQEMMWIQISNMGCTLLEMKRKEKIEQQEESKLLC